MNTKVERPRGKSGLAFGASIIAIGFISAIATPAVAQDTGKGEKAEDKDRDVVVVTAQRREQALQDVPISVAAVSGDTLTDRGINNAADLKYVVPGIDFTPSANVRGEGLTIRGVGTAVFADTIAQSVGTVIDGVPYAKSGQATADLVDVERIEVLRGPQGMLFGKNASAGVVSITTRKPEQVESFEARVSYAALDELKFNVIGNVPLGDTAALRVAFASTNADGVVKNIYRNENINNRDSKALRAKLLWEPDDRSSFYLIADYGRSDTLCCAWTLRSAPPGTTLGAANAAAGITPSPDNFEIAADQRFFQNSQTWGLSLEANYDFGWANLTSISSGRRWRNQDNNDPDLLPMNYLQINDGRATLDQFSEEVRLTSPSEGPFEWLAGVYLDRVKNHGVVNQAGRLNLGFLPAGTYLGNAVDTVVVNESAALFGELAYHLTDQLKLSASGRYTTETLDVDFVGYQSPGAIGTIRAIQTIRGGIDEQNFSGRLIAQYDVAPDVMVYASAARGYKGPGINTLGANPSDTEIVRPEIPTSYEAGIRSTLLNGDLIVNASAFSTDFKDYQATIFDQTVTPARFRITNAGKVSTQGIELELVARIGDDTTLTMSGAYIDAKYEDFKNVACNPTQTVLPLGTVRASPRDCIIVSGTQAVTWADGLSLPNQPEFSYNVSARHKWDVGAYGIDGMLTWAWRDDVVFGSNGDPNTVQEAYGLLGANISLAPDVGPWRLSVFAKNLLDQEFVNSVFPSPVLFQPGVYAQYQTPNARRIVGVALDVNF